jgi:hypothetical protein
MGHWHIPGIGTPLLEPETPELELLAMGSTAPSGTMPPLQAVAP